MGLILKFRGSPFPLGPDQANDGLAAGMHVDVFHCYLLLALTAMPVQSVQQHRVCARKLVGLVQVLTSALGRLLREHRASVTFHRGIVRGEELSRDHSLKLIYRPDPNESHHGRAALTVSFLFLRMSHPKTAGGLIDQDTIPVVRRGPTDEVNLVCSPQYRALWGERFTMVKTGETRPENNQTGFVLATSVTGVGTGERADRSITGTSAPMAARRGSPTKSVRGSPQASRSLPPQLFATENL
jgi:hypothetical protein